MPHIIKKILLPVLILVSSVAAFAQPTPEEKKLLFNKIDTLLSNYISYSRFLEDGKSQTTPEAIGNFKKLFVSENVLLPDEMSPSYFDKTKARPKLPLYDNMDIEAAKLKDRVPVLNPDYTTSLSKLNSLSDSLTLYNNGLNADRNSFFRIYDSLNSGMTTYKAELANQEKIITRNLAEFIVMVEANYPDGLSVKLLNSVVSFKGMPNNEVKLLIEKRTDGKLYGSGVKLQNLDTVLLTLKVSRDYSELQIANIEMVGYKLSFLNDKDHDFISDAIDACPAEQGLFQLTGCPPAGEKNFASSMAAYLENRSRDSSAARIARASVDAKTQLVTARKTALERLINAPPHWMISLGLSAGVISSTLTNASGDYPGIGREENPTSKFTAGKIFGGDLMAEHYFGAKSNFGVGAGVAFNSISGTVKKDRFHVEYMVKDVRGDSFTQLITANSPIEEKVTVSNFAIPFTAIYKGNITPTIGFKVDAGIALNITYKSKMSNNPNTSFRYEAVYKLTDPANSQNYYDPGTSSTETGFDPTSWLILQSAVSKHTNDVEGYFNDMSGSFSVGLHDDARTVNRTAGFSAGISFLFRPSISIAFRKGSSFNIGAFYTYTSIPRSDNYHLIDENRTYTTLMQGVSKISSSNFGIRISYSYSLFYYLSKWTKELSGLR